MPVHDRASTLTEYVERWERCRDALAGTDAVKEKAETYLPRLMGQGFVTVEEPGVGLWRVDEYAAYKHRANWYDASARTLEGILGALFRKPPHVDVPAAMEPHLEDLTQRGEPSISVFQGIASEILSVGFHGVLVDNEDDLVIPRPYWVIYAAEEIKRVDPRTIRGRQVLGRVVLQETITVPGDDEFETKTVERHRVLELDKDGLLVVRLFMSPDTRSDPVEVKRWEPVIRKKRLDYIPFQLFGPTSLLPKPSKPPLLGLIDVNLSHYRTSADLEEGRHKLAVPTPWAAGYPIGTVLRLGANVAHVTDNPSARMGMLEFTGAGLSELRLALQEKQDMMATMGARLLEAPKAGIESAEAIQLRTSGEQNFLSTLAATMSQGLTQLLRFHARWMSLEETLVQATINNDFIEVRISPQEAAQNLLEFQAGAISYETLYWRMSRSEQTRPNVTAEEERALIDAERPLAGEIDIGPVDDSVAA